MPAVEVNGLTKRFGATEALRGVSFEVEEATTLGLLGPNGAGKTTTVRILTTLLEADGGTAFVDGIDVRAEPRRVRARIGLTGQYAAVDERLTARENLVLVGRFFRMGGKQSKLRSGELLERFDLVDAADRVVKTYSGGMRRRLDIAMSLIARPTVLFLDEPTTGLDPRSRLAMWDLIDELVADGTTTLLTTQYLEEADRLAREIVVIDHGTVIARGTPDELKNRLGGEMAVITLAAGVDATAVAPALSRFSCGPVDLAGAHVGSNGAPATVSVPLRSGIGAPEIVRALDAASVGVLDVVVNRPTLDDVFLALTGHPSDDEE
ncbi:MAG: ATP-binding cassette domain-containing protein, partial [Acidimicrobiia bacterium]